MAEIKAGSTVKLASGGPIMTVRFIERDEAACDWFDGAEPKFKKFQVAQLKPVTPAI